LVFREVISMRKNADSPGARIKRRRMELGLSVEDVAKALGKDRSTIYRYEGDEIENMPVSVLVPLARVLRTSPTWILGFDNPEPKTKRVPLLGAIAAGEPIFASEEYGEYVEVPGDAPVDFCLRVRGDSMVDARIQDGDLVFIRQQPTVENGEIAAVMIDDEVTLKRFYKMKDGVILKPENSKYPPLYLSEADFKEVRILGKAVMFQSWL